MFKIEKSASVPPPPERPKRERVNWPWKNMAVGDFVKIEDLDIARKAQVNCHVYGRYAGASFSTKTINGVLHVWRTA